LYDKNGALSTIVLVLGSWTQPVN